MQLLPTQFVPIRRYPALFLIIWLFCELCWTIKAQVVLDEEVGLVVGGAPAEFGRYPFMAGLLYEINARPRCGGVLVAPSVVISAGHCDEVIQVLVGCYNLRNESEPNCELFNVSRKIVHPDFSNGPSESPGSLRNDFMVVVLAGTSSNLPIAFFPDEDFVLEDNQPFTVIGWGSTQFIGGFPTVLREVEVDIVPNDECNELYKENGDLNSNLIRSNMFCGAREGRDACQGDSGGPAFIRCDVPSLKGTADIVIGLVSWGFGCADPQFPGVYARLSSAVDFVAEIVDEEGYSLQIVTNIDVEEKHCVVNGTKAPTKAPILPTLSPTLPNSWDCDDFKYSGLDGCHCDCGAIDPDCTSPLSSSEVIGCNQDEVCIEGVCEVLLLPTNHPSMSPLVFETVAPTHTPFTSNEPTIVPTVKPMFLIYPTSHPVDNSSNPVEEVSEKGMSATDITILVLSILVIVVVATCTILKTRKFLLRVEDVPTTDLKPPSTLVSGTLETVPPKSSTEDINFGQAL